MEFIQSKSIGFTDTYYTAEAISDLLLKPDISFLEVLLFSSELRRVHRHYFEFMVGFKTKGGVVQRLINDLSPPRMQFVVENVSSSGVRLGKLLWTSNGQNAAVHTLETPLCLLYTRAGFIPHLTDEIVDGVVESSSHAAMLTLPTM